ncbi:MAG: hypothetical protein D6722_26470 [Bacteroidetes bacterium]|nr:MAG: hypothetical protein D6722_26470 [Bacteroidota bacterium]
MSAFFSPRLWVLIVLLGSAWACAPPGTPGTGGQPGSQDPAVIVDQLVQGLGDMSAEFEDMTRPNQVQAWVDKLVVKVQPGEDMPQIGLMQEGEVAEYLYQRTVRKTEFMLRGQRFIDPWILIKTKDGVMGWVHEGGVRYIAPNYRDFLGMGGGSTDPAARTRGPAGDNSLSQDFLIVPGKRVGPVRLKTSETDLVSLFGPGQVSRGQVALPDKREEECTIVWAGNANEFRITWKDDTRSEIKAVYFDQPRSQWFTPQGLTVGLAASEAVKVNKAPFSYYGFNWTYSGTIHSWRKGSLAPYEKYFYAVLSPRPDAEGQKLLTKYQGNQVFTTNAEGVEHLHMVISRIVVYLD